MQSTNISAILLLCMVTAGTAKAGKGLKGARKEGQSAQEQSPEEEQCLESFGKNKAVVGHCFITGCFMGHGSNVWCDGTNCLCKRGYCTTNNQTCQKMDKKPGPPAYQPGVYGCDAVGFTRFKKDALGDDRALVKEIGVCAGWQAFSLKSAKCYGYQEAFQCGGAICLQSMYKKKFKDCADKSSKPDEWIEGHKKSLCPASACPPKELIANNANEEKSVREIVELATQELNQTSAKAIGSVLALAAMSIVSFGVVLGFYKRRRSDASADNYERLLQ